MDELDDVSEDDIAVDEEAAMIIGRERDGAAAVLRLTLRSWGLLNVVKVCCFSFDCEEWLDF